MFLNPGSEILADQVYIVSIILGGVQNSPELDWLLLSSVSSEI